MKARKIILFLILACSLLYTFDTAIFIERPEEISEKEERKIQGFVNIFSDIVTEGRRIRIAEYEKTKIILQDSGLYTNTGIMREYFSNIADILELDYALVIKVNELGEVDQSGWFKENEKLFNNNALASPAFLKPLVNSMLNGSRNVLKVDVSLEAVDLKREVSAAKFDAVYSVNGTIDENKPQVDEIGFSKTKLGRLTETAAEEIYSKLLREFDPKMVSGQLIKVYGSKLFVNLGMNNGIRIGDKLDIYRNTEESMNKSLFLSSAPRLFSTNVTEHNKSTKFVPETGFEIFPYRIEEMDKAGVCVVYECYDNFCIAELKEKAEGVEKIVELMPVRKE